ncbi:hypothetical protein Aca07nite_13010 [Actinoplanes capillaceus]|uniref:Uncharacterized protein n=1 Tax=Actinoplanes campanulatus TaxID=113559 RepID=A0ABQ3WAF7_9ACTN|nr:hypothetical protein Aca07nite_13010 [Actinoplanes capillaceus]
MAGRGGCDRGACRFEGFAQVVGVFGKGETGQRYITEAGQVAALRTAPERPVVRPTRIRGRNVQLDQAALSQLSGRC